MEKRGFFIILFFLLILPQIFLISAELSVGIDGTEIPSISLETPPTPTNVSSLNVNNSDFLEGFRSSYFTPINLSILTGNLGIGTNSPAELLHVLGTTQIGAIGYTVALNVIGNNNENTPMIYLDSTKSANLKLDRQSVIRSNYIEFATAGTADWYIGSSDSELLGDGTEFFIGKAKNSAQFWIENGGNVGIKQTSPQSLLHIGDRPYLTASIQMDRNGRILQTSDNDGDSIFVINASGLADPINVFVDSVELFTMLDTGEIGIGTTSPSELLHINATTGIAEINVDSFDADSYVNLRSGFDGAGENSGVLLADGSSKKWSVLKDANNDFIIFDFTRLANALRVVDNGDMYLMEGGGFVGINTTSPASILHIAGRNPNILIENTAGSVDFQFVNSGNKLQFTHRGVGSRMLIDSAGQVGINTTTPQNTLNVIGSINQTSGNLTGNMIYGEMWNYTGNVSAWLFDINVAGVYYNMTNLSAGNINGITYTQANSSSGGSYFTIQVPGKYKIDSAISFEGKVNNRLYSYVIAKNFDVTQSRNCYGRRWISTQAVVGSATLSCILDLEVGDTFNLQIESEVNAGDIEIHAINVNAMRVGN